MTACLAEGIYHGVPRILDVSMGAVFAVAVTVAGIAGMQTLLVSDDGPGAMKGQKRHLLLLGKLAVHMTQHRHGPVLFDIVQS